MKNKTEPAKGIKEDKMKIPNKINFAAAVMALALLFTFPSCTKKEDALKGAMHGMTPEQSKRLNEIKKGVEESKKVLVARVNGVDITTYSLIREMNVVAPKYIPAGQPSTPELTAKVKKKALDNLIFRELAIQEAVKEGISVSPDAIDDVIGKVKAQAGSEEAYKAYLEERKLDEGTLRKNIERSHLFELITAREIFEKIKVDEKTLREVYEKEKSALMTKDNPSRQLSFEEARGLLTRKIKSERSVERLAEWDRELRKKAKIEVLPFKV